MSSLYHTTVRLVPSFPPTHSGNTPGAIYTPGRARFFVPQTPPSTLVACTIEQGWVRGARPGLHVHVRTYTWLHCTIYTYIYCASAPSLNKIIMAFRSQIVNASKTREVLYSDLRIVHCVRMRIRADRAPAE